MKRILLTSAIATATAANAGTLEEDYCALNAMNVGLIAGMIVTHNLADSSIYQLIDEFYAPGGWEPRDIWKNVRDMKGALDDGLSPGDLSNVMYDACIEK